MKKDQGKTLRVLHTSDWHLGRSLHEHPRDDEFRAFLDWMIDTIEREEIDVLLVAGDVFDTSNPPYLAQQMYYEFCTRLSKTCCRHAVITSGNHDSAVFIDVPGRILECLHIHVVGQPRFGMRGGGTAADEVVVLCDAAGEVELIVAAVPYLADGDVRGSEAGESSQAKALHMRKGMAAHYAKVAEACEEVRAGREIPVIAMGHLFVDAGLQCGDGVRQTYVGMLGGVDVACFGEAFDYVALGHIHVPQCVRGRENIRYSGSPLAMGFGEAGQQKSLCKIVFDGKKPEISLIPVERFHRIARIEGDKSSIEKQLHSLAADESEVYVSVTYTGTEAVESVIGFVQDILDGAGAKHVLCLDTQDASRTHTVGNAEPTAIRNESLFDFDEHSVFEMLLEAKGIPEEERVALRATYDELLIMVAENQ